jgi:hypothetical protein
MMEYNTTRNELVISEYGRNIQKMIEYTLTMEDRVKRTRAAFLIVDVMAQMHPQVKDTVDFKQKLWDHLHHISDFRMDVDCPYPKPTKQALEAKPEKIPYQENNIKFRQYGKNLQRIIEKAIELEDGKEKDAFVKAIANHLKKSYLNWNRDSVNDKLIFEHLELLSEGKLKLAENARLLHTDEILSRGSSSSTPARRKKFTKRPKDKNGPYRKHSSY